MIKDRQFVRYLVGLGNPGSDYSGSRHSVGRMILLDLANRPPQDLKVSEWQTDKKTKVEWADGRSSHHKFRLFLPENFMNNSGACLKPWLKTKAEISELLVIHDDLDLPLGTIKVSYGRGDGGHRGVASIIKDLKTKDFGRIRVGISPVTPSGRLKKPVAEKVVDFVIADFKPKEREVLKKVIKQVKMIAALAVEEGLASAINFGNQKAKNK